MTPPPSRAPLLRPLLGVGVVALVVVVLALVRGWSTLILGGAVTGVLLVAAYAVTGLLTAPRVAAAHTRQRVVRPGPLTGVATTASERPVRRRAFLGGGLVAVVGALGLLEWLGPERVAGTAWRTGLRLVTSDGAPIRPGDMPSGGMMIVWPEGGIGQDRSSALLLRLSGIEPEPPTVLPWVVEGEILAYSRVCTHAGCPVGMFRESDASMFCPCHQSTFATARGASVTFGPASRPLPQLPLGVDDAGFLVALDDFRTPVGPLPTTDERP